MSNEYKSSQYGYVTVPSWEYDIVIEEGIWSPGGTCIFWGKKEAVEWGERNAKLLMPDEVTEIMIDGQSKQVPIIQLYQDFYILSLDMDIVKEELNRFPDLVIEEDLPVVWFTKERIPVTCIIHTEKIPT